MLPEVGRFRGISQPPILRPPAPSAPVVTRSKPSSKKPHGERDERRQRILACVDTIPAGRIATYGAVARWAGLPRHARLVGRILGSLPPGTAVPWHRVVNASGAISARPGPSPARQRRRLLAEGVPVSPRGRVDLERFGLDDPDRPPELPRTRIRFPLAPLPLLPQTAGT
ncbi:MAG TPA: MGMT family protein [Planctomycetes bacterium]|nr:MGMT family protein [Planctomycetota bacterium]